MRFIAIVALALLLVGCESEQQPPSSTGQTLNLASLKGEWVLINYWAPWCKPCIEEIPQLNELHHQYAGITVFGVNYDGAVGEALAEQVDKLGVTFPTLEQDPSAIIGTPRPVVLPTTLVLDPEGHVVETLHGPQTVESLLAVTLQRNTD